MNDNVPEKVPYGNMNLEENVNNPEDDCEYSNLDHKEESEDPSENKFDPSWKEEEYFVEFIDNRSFNIWALWGESEHDLPSASLPLEWVQWSVINKNTLHLQLVSSHEGVYWLPGVDQVHPDPLVGPWDHSVEFIVWGVFRDSGIAWVKGKHSLGEILSEPSDGVESEVPVGLHQAGNGPFFSEGWSSAVLVSRSRGPDTGWGALPPFLCAGGGSSWHCVLESEKIEEQLEGSSPECIRPNWHCRRSVFSRCYCLCGKRFGIVVSPTYVGWDVK